MCLHIWEWDKYKNILNYKGLQSTSPKFTVYLCCTSTPTFPKGMIFWSFGPSPGLCHADRERRQKDDTSQIAPNTTGWGRNEEGRERKHHRKWERVRGENEKWLPGGVAPRDKRLLYQWFWGYQVAGVLYSPETVIRATPVWAPRKWLWLAWTPKRFLPKISTKLLCHHWVQVLASFYPCFQLHATSTQI